MNNNKSFDEQIGEILEDGVGGPGSKRRQESVDKMYEALDNLSDHEKGLMAEELLDDASKEQDSETRIGLLSIVAYLFK